MQEHTIDQDVTNVDLAQFDDDFEDYEADEDEFSPIPDGRYQVVVEQVELTRTKNKGQPMLKWSLRIISGPYANRMLFRNNIMATKQNIQWLKKDLLKAGLQLNKLSNLPDHLGQLLDVRLEVSKSTRGEYENVFINKNLGKAPTDRKTDEDIPF